MSKEVHGHGQWNIFVSVLIDSGKYFDLNTCVFTDELSVVQLCQREPLLRQYISKWLSKLNQSRKRSLALTNELRDTGNKFFSEITGRNDLAADYYTKAIFSAPKGSLELGLAHANRAACSLTSDRFYEEGYFDCKLALQFNYPTNSLTKLFERKQYLANQTYKQEQYMAETYQEMKDRNIELDDEKNSFLEAYQAKVAKKKHDKNNVEWSDTDSFQNKNLIEKSGPSVGRYLVAENAIEENEMIYTEKAFSFVPVYNYDQIDAIAYACQNCAKINCLPFPCYDCARASYCSPECLADHKPIHEYECIGHQKNLWIKLGIGYLAFRTFIVGFDEMISMLKNEKASTVEEVWSILMLDHHKEYAYGHVLRLVSHVDKVNVRNVLRYALTSQLMTIYLSEYTDFFSRLPKFCEEIMPVDDWKTLATTLMLRHMGQGYFNGHSQSQLQLMPPSLYQKAYGYGLYSIQLNDLHLVVSNTTVFSSFFPKLSLMNHSCDSNVRMQVNGSHLIAHAIRNIGKDEELTTCYGPHYKLLSTVERQAQLRTEFFFECKCNRCMSTDASYLKYYEYYCPKCGVLVDLHDVDMRWWYYMDYDYSHRINSKFVCDECGERLPINPSLMRRFERAAQGHIDKGYTFFSTDDFIITSNLLDLYFSTSNCLGKYHELKSRMAHTVLGYNILDSNEKLFPRLAYITMENYVNRMERYGIYTLEFIMVSSYALTILKLAKRIERTNTIPAMARDIAKIRRILDKNVIEKSLTILPPTMQMIFKNVIRDLDFDENGVDELRLCARTRIRDNRFNVSGSFNLDCGSNFEKSVG